MIIQQIFLNPEITLYLTNVNMSKGVLTYRTNKMPKLVQTEKFIIEEETVFLPLYKFFIGYLNKFIHENEQ